MLIGGTLARYISLRFVRTIALVFATVFGLVYTLDFVELMRRAGDAEGATPGLLARLSLYRTPAVAEQVFPFAVLFGSMAALLQLSRKLELVVARAAGISAWQFLLPGLGVAILLGAVTVGLYNPLSARLKLEASSVESTLFGRKMKGVGPDIWIQQRSVDGSAIIRAGGAVEATSTISGVTVFAFDKAGRFRERIEAPEGKLRDGYWEFANAQVLAVGDEPRTYASYLLSTNLASSQLRQTFMPPESVPFWRLPETIARTEGGGFDATRYRLQYDMLLARPLLFVAMVLLAAAVSLRFFRFGGVAPMVLGGVAAGFLLYVITEIMRDLGNAGLVAPVIAAWFPSILGSLLGTLALLYQEDG